MLTRDARAQPPARRRSCSSIRCRALLTASLAEVYSPKATLERIGSSSRGWSRDVMPKVALSVLNHTNDIRTGEGWTLGPDAAAHPPRRP